MTTEKFTAYDAWHLAATSHGHTIESWGICGSKHAHNSEGKVVGTWFAKFDTSSGVPHGELNIQSSVDATT